MICMKPVKYELVSCEIGGQKLFFNGIKIDTKQEIKRVTHGADYNAVGYVTGDRTVDFTLTNPKDARMIDRLYTAWIDLHMPFNMMIYSKNIDTGAWDLVATLIDCVLNKIDHNIKSKEEWKPGASGMALQYKRLNYQFDPQSGTLLDPVKDVITAMDSKLDKGSNIIGEVEKVGRVVRTVTGH